MHKPPEKDLGFWQRRKHDKWREVPTPSPALEAPVADSHAHLHSLEDPAWELQRCAANGVDLVCEMVNPACDNLDLALSLAGIADELRSGSAECETDALRSGSVSFRQADPQLTNIPQVVYSFGVHPHNASAYDDAMEARLRDLLAHPKAVAVGEIGLDFYYDNSPRDVQREVFLRQLNLAKELDMPVALHLRSGDAVEDGDKDHPANAHQQAFDLLKQEGFPQAGTLLHCCALPPEQLKPWIDADCYIAYGGALTFKPNDEAREGALLVPEDRLLLETDAPYMAPEPMRGIECTPAHVIFTAEQLSALRGKQPGEERREFLQQIRNNTSEFFGL